MQGEGAAYEGKFHLSGVELQLCGGLALGVAMVGLVGLVGLVGDVFPEGGLGDFEDDGHVTDGHVDRGHFLYLVEDFGGVIYFFHGVQFF